jgi:hypothetical protein
MRKIVAAVLLEIYAVALAWVQALGGVRTDEAKYLLDIPYPHPPLARFLLSLTSGLPFQEMFWRIVFASLMVQAVWLIWEMGKSFTQDQRSTLAFAWLCLAAVMLEAGSIMMAPLTALQGLVFVWLLLGREKKKLTEWQLFAVALFWLASLLTAYQAILYTPLVAVILHRAKLPRWQEALFLGGPLVVAVLFATAQPLIIASFFNAGTQNAGNPVLFWAIGLFQAWSIGGSVLIGILGIAGMILDRRWSLLVSTLLVSGFVFVSFRLYYAILFSPLFIGGSFLFFLRLWRKPASLVPPVLILSILCIMLFPPTILPTPARETMRAIAAQVHEGPVLIAGNFGHEWQYESSYEILRYRSSLIRGAKAVVCLDSCREVRWREGWRKLANAPVEVWVKTF